MKCVFWHTRFNSKGRETHKNENFLSPRFELHPLIRGVRICSRGARLCCSLYSSYPSFTQRTQASQKALTPSNRPNPSPMNPRRCFKCQGLGHITADCPNRRVITLAEWDAVKEEVVEEEKEKDIESPKEEEEEVITEANEGEMLVLRRALNSQRSENEEQRENIFHS